MDREDAVKRITGVLVGIGCLKVRLTETGRSEQRQTIQSLKASAKSQFDVDLDIVTAPEELRHRGKFAEEIESEEFELEDDDKFGYVTTLQTEALTDNLYTATFNEMRDFVHERNALAHQWTNDLGHNHLSLVVVQKFKR